MPWQQASYGFRPPGTGGRSTHKEKQKKNAAKKLGALYNGQCEHGNSSAEPVFCNAATECQMN
jgi:hypothetical protein